MMPMRMQGRGARYPLTTCPTCRRDVRVGPNSERIYPHDNPNTSDRCASAGQQIDLYGTGANPNGGAQ